MEEGIRKVEEEKSMEEGIRRVEEERKRLSRDKGTQCNLRVPITITSTQKNSEKRIRPLEEAASRKGTNGKGERERQRQQPVAGTPVTKTENWTRR